MRLHLLRFPAAMLAAILLTMSACAILQALPESGIAPSCHATNEQSSDQKSDSSIKFCCEAGLIPNKNLIFKEAYVTVMKFAHSEKSPEQLISPFDIQLGISSNSPPISAVISPLRI